MLLENEVVLTVGGILAADTVTADFDQRVTGAGRFEQIAAAKTGLRKEAPRVQLEAVGDQWRGGRFVAGEFSKLVSHGAFLSDTCYGELAGPSSIKRH